MPHQDSLRSAVYRTFVTCDDPKGVVECKTIRKSKIDHQKVVDGDVKQRTRNDLNVSSSSDKGEKREMVCKGMTDELNSSSSFQLKEVSRETQKLNQVIDSWSKDITFERHSKDIAKDLLKGALDLQESLVMLGKLQEASQYMGKLKKKQKDKPDGIGIERTKSERISDHRLSSSRLEFQKPRHSVDGASRDCYDELREVIRESFARQNLLPPSCASEKSHFDRRRVELSPDLPFTSFTNSSESSIEKACLGRRKMVLSSDLPSTSSSQSSMVQSQDFTSFDNSPPKVQQEKPKGPNLIARLMGLEGIPSKPQHLPIQKQLEKDMHFKQRRPVFEIDLPKVKKPPLVAQKVDPKRRTLNEIIETMQFKGLLRNKYIDGSNHETHQSDVPVFLKRFDDDSPPIVIMKPLYAPDLQAERFPPIYRKLQTGKGQNTRFSHEKGCRDRGAAPAKSKSIEVIQKKQPDTKTRTSSPGKIQQPKKEASEKRVNMTQQVAPVMRKSEEMKNAKFKDSAKLQDQSKMVNVKVRKPERKPNTSEKQAAHAKSTISDPISKRIAIAASHNSRNRKKNSTTDKSFKSSPIAKIENTEHKVENVQVVHEGEKDTNITITEVPSSEELHLKEVTDISENLVIDCIDDGRIFPSESTLPSIQCDNKIGLMEHSAYPINLDSTKKENFKSRATTRYLLLSNESFLSQAEELFDTDAWEPTVWQTISIDHDIDIADSKLLLDCANELLENKRSKCALAVDPLSHKAIKVPIISISFDKLVDEICDGIEILRSYNKFVDNTLSVDTLNALLERDIWSKGVVNMTWDLGWRTGFTFDEVEQVVTEIEKYLLAGVIDDVLTEFRL